MKALFKKYLKLKYLCTFAIVFLIFNLPFFISVKAQKSNIYNFFVNDKWKISYSLHKIPNAIIKNIQNISNDSLKNRIVPFDSNYAYIPLFRKLLPNNRLLFWGVNKTKNKFFICCESLSIPAIQIKVYYFYFKNDIMSKMHIFQSLVDSPENHSIENINFKKRYYSMENLISDVKYVYHNPEFLKYTVMDSLDIYDEGPHPLH